MKLIPIKKNNLILWIKFLLVISIFFFGKTSTKAQNKPKAVPINISDIISKINILKNAHSSPFYAAAATSPFGMLQMGAEYVWTKNNPLSENAQTLDSIYGFYLTHPIAKNKNITGDFMVLPLTDTFNINEKNLHGIGFQPKTEQAKPGFYAVVLNNNIECNFISESFVGIQEYKFKSNEGWFLWKLQSPLSPEKITDGTWEIINQHTIAGYKESQFDSTKRTIFMVAEFSEPIDKIIFYNNKTKDLRKAQGNNIQLLLKFKSSQPISVKIAISNISTEQAVANLSTIDKKTYGELKSQAVENWENELKKIIIETNNPKLQQSFLQALYYTLISPENIVENGQLFGIDQYPFYLDSGQTAFYTNWNSNQLFKSKISLLHFWKPNVVQDFIKNLWSIYKLTGSFPEQLTNLNKFPEILQEGTIPIVTELIAKEYKGFSYDSMFEALKIHFNNKYNSFNALLDKGFVPYDTFKNSVALTLQYAYEAWCLSQIALKLQLKNDYLFYLRKSQIYKNSWNQETLFFQAKNKWNLFYKNFDPFVEVDKNINPYYEGNAWQNNYNVIHDFNGYATLYGSIDLLLKRIDSLFFVEKIKLNSANKNLINTPKAVLNKIKIDSTTLKKNNILPTKKLPLGQYQQNFQDLHHVPYVPALINRLDLSAKYIRKIFDSFYLSNNKFVFENDGTGQMNTWFVWSCLGLYPLNPVDGNLVIGIPMVNSANIILPNMRLLKIIVDKKNTNPEAQVQEVYFNNVKLKYNYIHYTTLLQGGILKYIVN